MRKILASVCSIGIGLMATPSAAEQDSTPDQEFFSSDDILDVIIEADLDALTLDRKGKRPSPHPGVMMIGGDTQKIFSRTHEGDAPSCEQIFSKVREKKDNDVVKKENSR